MRNISKSKYFKSLIRPLKVEDKCGIVYHACEWDKNYLSEDLRILLDSFLMHSECEFVFLEGLL